MFESPVDVEKGKIYSVPCVKGGIYVFPVVLPSHSDGGDFCLDKLEEHYHIDFRFIEKHPYNALSKASCSSVFLEDRKAIREKFDSIEALNTSSFFFVNRWYRRFGHLKLVDRKCPHKGLVIINACGKCPGHGLIWDLKQETLSEFCLPFFLEMANDESHSSDNPKGEITHDDKCVIKLEKRFDHNGVIIMVDSNGKRYGTMKQTLKSMSYKVGDTLTFETESLCSQDI
jgi:hypothetical protein